MALPSPDWFANIARGADVDGSEFRIASWMPREPLLVQQNSLLSLLAVLHEERLAPGPWIAALATEHRGAYRRQLKRLAERMNAGTPWLEALEQTPDALSDDAVLALRLGHQSGTMQSTLSMLRTHQDEAAAVRGYPWRSLGIYWMIAGFVLLFVLNFLSYFIAPTLSAMVEEFDAVAPRPFTSMEMVFGWSQRFGWLALSAILMTFYLGGSLPLRRWLRKLRRHLPGSGSNPQIVAGVLRLLGHTLLNGRPLAGALSTLGKFHTNDSIRHRLLVVRNEIEHGAEPWSSLNSAGLLSHEERTALQTESAPASQAWLFEQFAQQREIDSRHRRDWFSIFVHPAIVLAYGCIVLWMAYAVFSAVYGMARSLA